MDKTLAMVVSLGGLILAILIWVVVYTNIMDALFYSNKERLAAWEAYKAATPDWVKNLTAGVLLIGFLMLFIWIADWLAGLVGIGKV